MDVRLDYVLSQNTHHATLLVLNLDNLSLDARQLGVAVARVKFLVNLLDSRVGTALRKDHGDGETSRRNQTYECVVNYVRH